MNNAIKLLEDVIKNMEYIRLLITAGRKYVPPLNTFNLVMNRLNRLKVILEDNYLTPKQIREAVIRLEKPIDTPIIHNTFTGKYPFYRDSVGTEELHE